MTETSFFTRLKNRGIINISGKDRLTFLQGLITNDIHLLQSQPCLYSCLLNPQGKFLYDFFVSYDNESLFLDCEGGPRAQEFAKLLSIYKLGKDVQISVQPNIEIFAVFHSKYGHQDPRHPCLGNRSFQKPDIEEKPFEFWDKRRILQCIPDGSRDMVIGKSTMLESRIDKINGLSFAKGCYMGQELTARTHYRGLVKRHLYTIEADSLPDSGSEIKIDDRIVGEMRSSCGRIGLAFLKDEDVTLLNSQGYKVKLL